MFWSGNYIVVRELSFLLKEENVTLTQVLEADDILQECKADNKALIHFVTKPEILAELITLITEEPPKNVELAAQYRHANVACEVLTSHLSTLSDRLSMDTLQMNRLCDFINRDPPLNPLLASYFSRTIEMFLERSSKQDWYLYHIVCLRVLDFLRSRRDFLPNLLRHLATSAIVDVFKCFIRLDDLFNKFIMEAAILQQTAEYIYSLGQEKTRLPSQNCQLKRLLNQYARWFDEHQLLDCLIQIVCGTYILEPVQLSPSQLASTEVGKGESDTSACEEKGRQESSEKVETNHKADSTEEKVEEPVKATNSVEEPEKPELSTNGPSESPQPSPEPEAAALVKDDALFIRSEVKRARMSAIASDNAASLLCDLILTGCVGEGCTTRPRTSWTLGARVCSAESVRALLEGMFTCSRAARTAAIVNGARVLLAMLAEHPVLGGESGTERSAVELHVAPHLPLLHQALLQNPYEMERQTPTEGAGESTDTAEESILVHEMVRKGVGQARVHVAALLAQLAASEVEEVPSTLITLGTAGVLIDLMFKHPDNNFLHANVYGLIKAALNNKPYRLQYATHLLLECDLMTKLMDAFEENEEKKEPSKPRAGYMGYVILALRRIQRALDPSDELMQSLQLPTPLAQRWTDFCEQKLMSVCQQHDTYLGGYYPSDNLYDVDGMGETLETNYEFNDVETYGLDEFTAKIPKMSSSDVMEFDNQDLAKMAFFEKAKEMFSEDMWNDDGEGETEQEHDSDEVIDDTVTALVGPQDVLAAPSPWEAPTEEPNTSAGDGWANFTSDAFEPPVDPFANFNKSDPFSPAKVSNAPSQFDKDGFALAEDGFVPSDAAANDFASSDSQFPTQFENSAKASSFWSSPGDASTQELQQTIENFHLESNLDTKPLQDADASTVELANNLLTAMSSMTPEVIANIVNANLSPIEILEQEKVGDSQVDTSATETDDGER